MSTRTIAAPLAVAATVTAACLSIQAGMQRGGLPVERALWVAVGVVLVIAAHLLPALYRSLGWGVRTAGGLIWIGCVAATCYGHAVFFLTSARHAGEIRAAGVPVATPVGRDLTSIARDRADAIARLARANARRCAEPCPGLAAERTALAARLEAIEVEQAEATRARSAIDHAATARDAARSEPVTSLLSALGWSAARADLLAGLAFALVLEAVACFAWLIALRPPSPPAVSETPVTQGSNAVTIPPGMRVTALSNAPLPPATPLTVPDDVTRVLAGIAASSLRPTVIEIRKFLGCSQTRAVEVRRSVLAAESLKETMHANLDA